MKKVLGLDLGTASVGWSLIETKDDGTPVKILGMGSRIVPLSPDDTNEFARGSAISKNQARTQKRSQRKGYDRWQLRRDSLNLFLREHDMLPDEELNHLPVLALWQLRADAATPGKKLSPQQIGRVLIHLNHKRGYRHGDDKGDEKQQRDYVAAVNGRYASLKETGMTIGQFFASELEKSRVTTAKGASYFTFRTKDRVYPRRAYEDEFYRIMDCQREFYPDLFTDKNIRILHDRIIFFHREPKSCNYLVNRCEFCQHVYTTADGRKVVSGPKVAPRSSPLFQVCKIWESINNIRLKNRRGEDFVFTAEHRQKMFDFMSTHRKMTVTDLYKILGIKKSDGWWGSKAIGAGLQGDTTRVALTEALAGKHDDLLRFDLPVVHGAFIDERTGEALPAVSEYIEKEPFFRLWHCVYSIKDEHALAKTLYNHFGIDDPETVSKLHALGFRKEGFGNKSNRFMRRILPWLQTGMMYSEACEMVGANHSGSMTAEENAARPLLDRLPQIRKNALRQPVVEKILNQMVNVVNAVLAKYGPVDSICVELARELKSSREEREKMWLQNRKNQANNDKIAQIIREKYNEAPTRNMIDRYKLYTETDGRCIYCNKRISEKEFLFGVAEKEHIIPKSLIFDDSFGNKITSCRDCNHEKDKLTAFDYMKKKGDNAFEDYVCRVEEACEEKRISFGKRAKLLMPASEIPTDFIDRQLRLSQYIARKAVELLDAVCRDVYCTSGSVTDFFRRIWDYDEILQQVNIDRYRAAGQTEFVERKNGKKTWQEERIKNWNKRMDHRHHALDALVIAMTRRSFINCLNHLNTLEGEDGAESKRVNLEKWAAAQPHFSHELVAGKLEEVAVSFKAGKRAVTPGKRRIKKGGKRVTVQEGLLVPRGAIVEEHVHGMRLLQEKDVPLKRLFEAPEAIVSSRIRSLVEARIAEHGGNVKAAFASTKKQPILLKNGSPLVSATCYTKETVMRYPLGETVAKNVDFIVSDHVRELVRQRIAEVGEKDAFKEPLYFDAAHTMPIRAVRMRTRLTSVVAIKYDGGIPIGFARPGNNHHMCIYEDAAGNRIFHCTTLFNAVQRKNFGLPVIIEDTSAARKKAKDCGAPVSFINDLPADGLHLVESLQLNEIFIVGMTDEEIRAAEGKNDKAAISNHLFRLQTISDGDIRFRKITDTTSNKDAASHAAGNFVRIASIDAYIRNNPVKVFIDVLGNIRFK